MNYVVGVTNLLTIARIKIKNMNTSLSEKQLFEIFAILDETVLQSCELSIQDIREQLTSKGDKK